ncbi:glutamyl-tRNA reductase-binding protein, chloroplastic isoform X2 [Cornus florida]|uniref:glutamyl-tRNA reductase-binding protein, chloroplastic isoform X2 n=1 Tax=Cornus florida TaxID=4283 RepID=UPI002896D6F0|nr:glutamyl-tRNA reductase-binding protein, chloroplastic isoform X2 [Cornus florida]
MVLQTQSLTTHLLPSVLPTAHFSRPPLSLSKPTITTQFNISKPYPFRKSLVQPLKCSVSVVSEPTQLKSTSNDKPFPAEVSRTIMELSSVATLSTLTQDGWPLGIGVRFAVDSDGTPVLCLNVSNRQFSIDRRSSLHVQKLHSIWKKKFEEEVDEDLIYVVAVERVLQIEDFKEDGIWVTSSDYRMANPDPLRDFAEKIVNEINIHNIEDIHRFCNIYVDLDFQVTEAKMVWVDRLGFDMRLSCPQNGIFEVRIPFPREVMDEKGAKSSFNCMSQRAWEVEKNYHAPDFKKVKQLKKIACRV